MIAIIDRFEGDRAILEIRAGEYAEMSLALLPDAKQGDVVRIDVDTLETQKRKQAAQQIINDLFVD